MTTPPPIPRSEVHVYAVDDVYSGVAGALRFSAVYKDLVHVGRFDYASDEAKAKWIFDFATAAGADPSHMGWMFHKIEQAAEEAVSHLRKQERLQNRISALEVRADETERVLDYLKTKVDELQTQVTSLYHDEKRFVKYESEQKAIIERLNRQAKSLSLLRDGGAK
jgi:uncharacterized coiled-coil protein SlyX